MISVHSTEKTTLDLKLAAFAKPDPAQKTLAFHSLSSIPEYVPVLVEITSKTGDSITYHALNPADLSRASVDHDLNLTNLDDVWARLPSTLRGWDAVTAPCALLFLSESYLKGGNVLANGNTERQDVLEARPSVQDGCPKWPCTKGDVREIQKVVDALEADNKQLHDENAKLQIENVAVTAAYTSLKEVHVKVTDIYALLKQHVTSLQPTFTPEQLAKFDLSLFP